MAIVVTKHLYVYTNTYHTGIELYVRQVKNNVIACIFFFYHYKNGSYRFPHGIKYEVFS